MPLPFTFFSRSFAFSYHPLSFYKLQIVGVGGTCRNSPPHPKLFVYSLIAAPCGVLADLSKSAPSYKGSLPLPYEYGLQFLKTQPFDTRLSQLKRLRKNSFLRPIAFYRG